MGPCLAVVTDIQYEPLSRASQNIDLHVDPCSPKTLTLTLTLIVLVHYSCTCSYPESHPIDISARMCPRLVMTIEIQF